MLNTVFDILKVPADSGSVLAVSFMDAFTDVLQIMLLGATLIWTIIKVAQALKDFHDKD